MIEERLGFASSTRIADWLGCTAADVAARLRSVRESGDLVCAMNGGWVLAQGGQAFPSEYLDSMMRHLGCRYYLGGHFAAGSLGMHTHGIAKVTVMVSKPLKNRKIVGSQYSFVHRRNITAYPTLFKRLDTMAIGPQGYRISSTATTLFDIVQQGVHYLVANVAGRMLEHTEERWAGVAPVLNPHYLAKTSLLYPITIRQRTGHILQHMSDWVDVPFDLEPLHATIPKGTPPTSLFSPGGGISVAGESYDPVWKIRVDGNLDPDL